MDCSLLHHRESIEAGEIHNDTPSASPLSKPLSKGTGDDFACFRAGGKADGVSKPVSEQAKEVDSEDDAFPTPIASPGKSLLRLFADNDQGDSCGGNTTAHGIQASMRRMSMQACDMSKSAAACLSSSVSGLVEKVFPLPLPIGI
jgi:hypothetical protein